MECNWRASCNRSAMGCSEVQWSAIEGKGAQSSEMERNGGHHGPGSFDNAKLGVLVLDQVGKWAANLHAHSS
eukprot:scaffold147779_cov17-Tisochrysis_lutea.AAC.1